MNIKLIRVDNRLVHGQTGVSWSNALDIQAIVVIDDVTSSSIFSRQLMTSIAKHAGVQIYFWPVEGAYDELKRFSMSCFVLVRDINSLICLFNQGLPSCIINLGNLHYEKDKKPLNKLVYLSQTEIFQLRQLMQAGFQFYHQNVPGSVIETITEKDLD